MSSSGKNHTKLIVWCGVVLLIVLIIGLSVFPTSNPVIEEPTLPATVEVEVDEVPFTVEQEKQFNELKSATDSQLLLMKSRLNEASHSSLQRLAGNAQTLREDGDTFWSENRPQYAIDSLTESLEKAMLFLESLPLQESLVIAETDYMHAFQATQVVDAFKWSRDRFLEGSEYAEQAEKLLEQGRVKETIERYELATESLLSAAEEVRVQVEAVIADARDAYERNQQAEAIEFSKKWVEYQPNSGDAKRFLNRSRVLDKVSRLSHEGDQYLSQREYAFAKEVFEKALKLDADYSRAVVGLEKVQKLLEGQAVEKVLRACNDAIDAGDYEEAYEQVQIARAIDAQDERVVRMHQIMLDTYIPKLIQEKIDAGEQEMSVGAYKSAIKWAEDTLIWHAESAGALDLKERAEQAYKDALTAEKYVKAGLAKMESNEVQSVLDSKLYFEKAVELNPLSENALKQLAACERVIVNLTKPVSVYFESDGMSQVQIFKVGKFEPFTSRLIDLKPGRYQIKVKRRGHKDGFFNLTIEPGLEPDVPFLTTDGAI